MRLPTLLLAGAVLAGGVYVGARPAGPLPPLGPLLDPANGAWAAAVAGELARDASASVAGLGGDVRIVYDDRAVPHIYAASRADAWRAMGYVVARDRLFQLELQARAAEGTLTELVGARALPLDQQARRLGMPRAAETNWAALADTAYTHRAAVAFADGVNAWIDQLRPRDVPVEYRLLGRQPARWAPIDMLHLFNRMALTLSYAPTEVDLAEARALVGDAAVDALFPVDAPIEEPIQPAAGPMPQRRAVTLPPPGRGTAAAVALSRALAPAGDDALLAALRREASDVTLGSNNWAVAPQRTAAGHALLAGDPHLELTLPSIWFELHLVVPDTLDAYGVTIPGAAGVIIGFNRDIAWTVTNTGADVVDFWRETVDDSTAPARYRLDGAWRAVETRLETYRDPAGRVVGADTVRYTHRGPLRRVGEAWLSMRWTALETGDGGQPFLQAAEARSVEEFRRLTREVIAPAQNFLVADRSGTIAIRSTGRYPVRAGDGRGDVIRDGSTAANDWQGWWSPDEYPQAVAPAQGFLASANQDPFAADTKPRYLGSDWPTPWRAMQINGLLRGDSAVTPATMAAWQTDPTSARAAEFLPALVAASRRPAARAEARRAGELLAAWDGRYTRENTRAVLFESVMSALTRLTWDELRSREDSTRRVATPSDAMLAVLLRDSTSAWWDLRSTAGEVERRDALLELALAVGYAQAVEELGEPGGERWRWDRVRHANVRHLLRLDAFSQLGIPVQGGPGLLNPSSGGGAHGASWRMVVELGPEVRGWGIYPGGQSGNPMSARYADRLPQWTAGALDTLRTPRTPDALPADRRSAELRLTPAR